MSFSEEFLNLSFSSFCDVVCRDTLIVRTEEDIVDAVLRWIDFDVPARKCYMQEAVLRCIMACLVKDEEVTSLLENYPHFHDLDVVKWVQHLRYETQDIKCRGSCQVIVLCGGKGQVTG